MLVGNNNSHNQFTEQVDVGGQAAGTPNSININSASKPVVNQYMGRRKKPQNKHIAANTSKANWIGANSLAYSLDNFKKSLAKKAR